MQTWYKHKLQIRLYCFRSFRSSIEKYILVFRFKCLFYVRILVVLYNWCHWNVFFRCVFFYVFVERINTDFNLSHHFVARHSFSYFFSIYLKFNYVEYIIIISKQQKRCFLTILIFFFFLVFITWKCKRKQIK